MPVFTPLSALLGARRRDGDAVHFEITEDWLQGRTSFGGIIATLAVQAMRDVAGAGWPGDVQLRALQTSFIGPVAQGPIQVRVQVLREGKSVRQVQALVQQGGQTAALLLGVFGGPRETALPELAPPQPPAARGPDETPALPFVPGVAPNFMQHLDMRWSEGGLPFTGTEGWHSRIHLTLKDEPGAPPLELLTVLLADAPPTPALSRFRRPTPASSVSWELELRPLAHALPPQGWWRIDTEALAAAGGYINQVSRLWSPAGDLAALGYQVVTVYG